MYFSAEQIMISFRLKKMKGKIMGGKVLHPEEKSEISRVEGKSLC